MINTWQARLFRHTQLELGEGAYWHPQWNSFLYVDIKGKKLGRINIHTGLLEERQLPQYPGTVVATTGEQLLLGLQGSLSLFNFETNHITTLIAIEPGKPDNRCNDGKCDAAGRFWIGTMHIDAQPQQGSLYCYDGTILQEVLTHRSISNGICWSPDNTVMYYIDSADRCVKAYDIDINYATLSNEREVVNINTPQVLPDGMTIDSEGMLWVAIWGGSCINRYNPHNGTLIGQVTLPVPHVTSCAFGGKGLQQLFITTARKEFNAEQLTIYPLSGSLFIADVGIAGLPPHFFKAPKLR